MSCAVSEGTPTDTERLADHGDQADAARAPARASDGRQEWLAAGVVALATVFFWWQGFRVFTVAGALVFVVALLRLGAYRRRLALGSAIVERRRVGGSQVVATLALLLFPLLLAGRVSGALPWPAVVTEADVGLGGLLYLLGVMELVELATLRALSD